MAKSQPAEDKEPYIKAQREYFDERANHFAQPIPDSILKQTRKIVASAELGAESTVLDVATGAGALVGHFLEAGVKPENIVGVDLSSEMLSIARNRFPSVCFHQGDIANLRQPLPSNFPKHIELFEAVFFNACFGNMWDQQESLAAAARLLSEKGQIVISHPLGYGFVDSLHRSEPHIVPHRLPGEAELEILCAETDLMVAFAEIEKSFYLVRLRKK